MHSKGCLAITARVVLLLAVALPSGGCSSGGDSEGGRGTDDAGRVDAGADMDASQGGMGTGGQGADADTGGPPPDGPMDSGTDPIALPDSASEFPPDLEVLPRFNEQRLETAKSLQGLQNRSADRKIWLDRRLTPDWPAIYADKYGYLVSYSAEANTDAGLINVLSQYSDAYEGYILYDRAANAESTFVALSLAGLLDAVVIDASLEAAFIAGVGEGLVADVRGRDAAWLWANYGPQFDTGGMALPDALARTHAADFMIMNRRPIIPSVDQATSEAFLGNLDSGAMLTAWVPMYLPGAEDEMAEYFSTFDVKLVGGVNTLHNFSVSSEIYDYSGGTAKVIEFDLDVDPTEYSFDPTKHYLTLYLISGGSFNYINYRYLAPNANPLGSYDWINVPHTAPLTWSITPLASQYGAAALAEIYARAGADDGFATSYSGHAYIHPSAYPSLTAFASEMDTYLARADITAVATQESDNFIDQAWVDTFGAKLLAPARVTGLYVQRGPFGQIFAGPGNKPVITRRVGMNIDGDPAKLASFIQDVNGYAVSPTTEAGYSVILVNLERTTVQDAQALYDNLAPHIEVVTLDELFVHIRANVLGG